jgi:hypothetical protein
LPQITILTRRYAFSLISSQNSTSIQSPNFGSGLKLPAADARTVMLSTRVNAAEHKAILVAIKADKAEKTVWLRKALLKAANAA